MVDYFLTWPQSALEGVAKGIINDYSDLESEAKLRPALAAHMGQTHATGNFTILIFLTIFDYFVIIYFVIIYFFHNLFFHHNYFHHYFFVF